MRVSPGTAWGDVIVAMHTILHCLGAAFGRSLSLLECSTGWGVHAGWVRRRGALEARMLCGFDECERLGYISRTVLARNAGCGT